MDCRNSAMSQIPKVEERGLLIAEMMGNGVLRWHLCHQSLVPGPWTYINRVVTWGYNWRADETTSHQRVESATKTCSAPWRQRPTAPSHAPKRNTEIFGSETTIQYISSPIRPLGYTLGMGLNNQENSNTLTIRLVRILENFSCARGREDVPGKPLYIQILSKLDNSVRRLAHPKRPHLRSSLPRFSDQSGLNFQHPN
jgi:hypothetical protein